MLFDSPLHTDAEPGACVLGFPSHTGAAEWSGEMPGPSHPRTSSLILLALFRPLEIAHSHKLQLPQQEGDSGVS